MIYFDNSATTPMFVENLDIIKKYGIDNFYNPSALYEKAGKVHLEIKKAKDEILYSLGALDGNIVFTGSGTEADNMAIMGIKKFKGAKIIVSDTEHSAVYNTARQFADKDIEVIAAPTDRYGRVLIDKFEGMLDKNVALVSIMHVCNETGAVNDIKKLVEITKKLSPRAKFHSDGVQAAGKIKINLSDINVDLYSLSSHKFHGMKGVGLLYIKKGVNINPIIYGGGQEYGLRSATENVSGIITTSYSLKKSIIENNTSNISAISEYIKNEMLKIEPKVIINHDSMCCTPYIISCAFPNTRGEVLLRMLEDNDIIIGTGSACSSHNGNKRIPKALGLPAQYEMGMIRISLSNFNTKQEAERFIIVFKEVYTQLKNIINK